jgi:two-component system, OmpR family, sensor kinase
MSDNTIKTELLVHDLKVPISVIDAGAKSLLNRQDAYGPLTDKQIKVLKRIIRNALVTQRLANDILEIGRSREGVMIMRNFSIASLIKSVLIEIFDLSDPGTADIIRNIESFDELSGALMHTGVKLYFDHKTWDKVVQLDEAKVRQILRNLVSNAFKYRANLVEIEGTIEAKCLKLKVRDDGKGISDTDQQNIFKTYFTTGKNLDSAIQSHGLGLAGVMILLKDMGGKLTLNSLGKNGTEFIVNIPLF